MRKSKTILKRMIAVGLSAALVVSWLPGSEQNPSISVSAAESGAEQDTTEPLPFHDMTTEQLVKEMGTGWGLGNTFDGHSNMNPSETQWQSDVTTQKLITAVHDSGFNTIRIPVTWGNMIKESKDQDGNNVYSIDEAWISRVQDVVDYAISEGMYVVINMHHDGAMNENGYLGWIQPTYEPFDELREKFAGAWSAIATYFKNYDEHLVFESMNEVKQSDQSKWTIAQGMERVNVLNQDFVDAVRAAGGNNDRRWLSVPGIYTNISWTCDEKFGFQLPTDPTDDGTQRIFVEVHEYADVISPSTAADFAKSIQKLVDTFTSKGVPVMLSEYGRGCHIREDKDTEERKATKEAQREYYHEAVNQLCKVAGVVPIVWDNNSEWYEGGTSDAFKLFNRDTATAKYPRHIAAILRGINSTHTTLDVDNLAAPDGASPTVINQVTAIAADQENVSLTIGDSCQVNATVTPADSNDMLVWSSDDTAVATVAAGKIVATGIGNTVVHVKSYSGSASKDIVVTVSADTSVKACDVIETSIAQKTLQAGESIRLNAKNATEGSEAYLTYRSSNKAVATVSKTGKVVAVNGGMAEITIMASSGFSKTVSITVEGGTPAEPQTTNTPAPTQTTQPAPQQTNPPAATTDVKEVTKSGAKYSIDTAKGTAVYVANTEKKKNAVVPGTLKVDGKSYKITSIEKNAFKGNKKLTKVTIGTNVTKIGANAFSGCSNLKNIVVQSSQIKSVGKNAWKGIHKKAVIKVPKAKLKSYKKLFKGKGQGSKVKIKK